MPHVLIPNQIHADGIGRLRAEPNLTLDLPHALTPDEMPARLASADAIIVRGMTVDAAMLEAAPRLRFVCRHGVGYDNVDVPALTARGIVLAITPEANAPSVAEHALMLILALARRVVDYNSAVRAGEWRALSESPTVDLGGRTILLGGFGRIGTRTAKLCAAFGMRVLVHDPFIPANTIRGLGFEPAGDLQAALGAADVVSLHCPSNANTRGMVGASFLSGMKRGSILINTARGTLVDEAALEAALRTGHIAAAGLDVVTTEPMVEPIPLLSLPNVIVTPHVAASTTQGLRRMAVASAENVIRFFAGALDRDVIVNPEALRS